VSPPPVAVIGAGAAGLMAALTAARSGAPVVLLESTRDGGRKILISGGGRCNVLPSVVRSERYVTDSSPNTLRKILLSWPLEEQRAFFEDDLGIPLVLEEESGKLFPAGQKAREVRDALVAAAREAGVQIWFEARVVGLSGSEDGSWRIDIHGAPPLTAGAVVLATGGLSVPATGSDGAGFSMARRLGHTLHPTYPALTPLRAEPHPHAHLAGVSLDVTIRAPGARPRFESSGGFLFTHHGWSGPAVLDISHLASRSLATGHPQELTVQWCPLDRAAWEEKLLARTGALRPLLSQHLPRRLADHLLDEAGIQGDVPLANLRREDRKSLLRSLTEYVLPWTDTEGYRKAEVTGGGIPLSEIHPATMQSRVAPGLFLCGEVLDAFGPIGGFNFLWAWATGRRAGAGAGTAWAGSP